MAWHYVSKVYNTLDNSDTEQGVYGSYDPVDVLDAKIIYALTEHLKLSLAVDNLAGALVLRPGGVQVPMKMFKLGAIVTYGGAIKTLTEAAGELREEGVEVHVRAATPSSELGWEGFLLPARRKSRTVRRAPQDPVGRA